MLGAMPGILCSKLTCRHCSYVVRYLRHCLSLNRYWKLDVDKVCGTGSAAWDKAVHDASEEYKCRPV